MSDAMHQVLDYISALGSMEDTDGSAKKIVWRLTEAHTNSPPFTVTTEAFSIDPVVSVAFEADRVTSRFKDVLLNFSVGQRPSDISIDSIAPLKRLFSRNLEGIGLTQVKIRDSFIDITPSTAKNAVIAIEKLELELQDSVADLRHTEFGSVECIVFGLTQWNNKPALSVIDRLGGQKLTCVLSVEVAAALGEAHSWSEAWQGRRLLVSGALHYGADGALRRIDAEDAYDLPYTSVSLSDLADIDLLQGRTVSEHVSLLREG